MITTRIRKFARKFLPERLRHQVGGAQRRLGLHEHPVGQVDFGDLRRTSPISPVFGLDRSLPLIDRHYIEAFLSRNARDVRGRVLEMGDNSYTRRFGGDSVQHSDVMHLNDENPAATLVGDLARADHIPANGFDCIILTQTLQMIYDVQAAMRHLHRMLKPGGVLLATAHGISRIARREGEDDWGEYWHFTAQSAKRLFEAHFLPAQVQILTFGNVLSASASLYGLSAADLTAEELEYSDPDFELIIAVRAVKSR